MKIIEHIQVKGLSNGSKYWCEHRNAPDGIYVTGGGIEIPVFIFVFDKDSWEWYEKKLNKMKKI